jgi:hypothetical protein
VCLQPSFRKGVPHGIQFSESLASIGESSGCRAEGVGGGDRFIEGKRQDVRNCFLTYNDSVL